MPFWLLLSFVCRVAFLSVAVAYLFLVRSMRILALVMALAMTACAAQLQVVGPYASRLSSLDIREIVALFPRSPTVSPTYTRLEATRPDRVRITVGGFAKSQGTWTADTTSDTYTAIRRSGRWVLSGSSETERTITVY